MFVSAGESDSSAQYTRREGRRVLLRAIDDVERRFSEPVFSRTSTFEIFQTIWSYLDAGLYLHSAQRPFSRGV